MSEGQTKCVFQHKFNKGAGFSGLILA